MSSFVGFLCVTQNTQILLFFCVFGLQTQEQSEGREMNIFARQVHYLGPGKSRHFSHFPTADIDSMKNMYNFSSFCVFIQNQKQQQQASGKRQNQEYDSVWVSKIKPDAGICTVIPILFFHFSFLHFIFKYLLYICMFHGLYRCSVI